jgi:hypothetical protein
VYDLDGTGRTVIRGGYGMFWNFTPGGTSSSKAQNPPFNQITTLTTTFGTTLKLSDGFPPPPGVDPNRPPAGSTRSVFDINFRDAYAHNWNINLQRQFGTNYMAEVAYVGSAGRNMLLKGAPNEAPAVVGVTNSDVNRPYIAISPQLRDLGLVESTGVLDYHGLLMKFQRRFANNFSFFNSYTWSKAIDYNSDNDGDRTVLDYYNIALRNRGVADYSIRHVFSSNWIYEFPWARQAWYGGWQISGILFLRSGYPFNITQTQAMLSKTNGGTGVRPNLIGDPWEGDSTIDRWFNTAAFRAPADNTGTYGDFGRNVLTGPGQFNIDMSLIKNTRIGGTTTELRIEAFNILNHPQFGQPNGQLGNASFGRITAMLTNPACSTCGTTERNVQIGVKVRF